MLPYQLPSCIQFVYADMNQAELDRLPHRVVPGPEHEPAARLNGHYVAGLVPDVVSYPELAMRLRLRAEDVVDGWLPPNTRDEPKVNPLHRGAGQYPTIGRASLFGTFLDGILSPAVRDIREAVGKLSNSGEDLAALGGKAPRSVDVFVAFSVAGGTGAGIFYDYLHIIADTLAHNTAMRVKVYPLVLMPSAFQQGLGGGRAAQLNAGRALLDLFRLVDQQNGADAELMLRGAHDRRTSDPEDVAVTYPGNHRLVMTPGTLQTGFLFSQPAGASREDMHRSIASLVLSLVGTEMSQAEERSGEHNQSFADSFVNEQAQRQIAADNGIGGKGVSTALVASLTVPVDELAGIVGSRLLREAIEQISGTDGRLESTRADIQEFLIKSGIDPVLHRQGVEYSDPAPAIGAKEIATALNIRRDSMRIGIDALRTKLGQEVPQLVARFDPDTAVRDMLTKMDVFRLQRVVNGHPALRDDVERAGVRGLLQLRRGAPQAPVGYGAVPPGSPELKDRTFRKVQWGDEPVVMARGQQDGWYLWQTHVSWAHAWDTHTPQWSRPLEQVQREVAALTRALTDFGRADVEDFGKRSSELYRKRVGVSYMLPSGAGGMEQFYQQVVRRLREKFTRERRLDANSHVSGVLGVLVGPETWAEAFSISIEKSPEQAVSFLRERAKSEVKKFLRAAPTGEQPILPRLHDLLIEAAGHGHGTGTTVDQDYLDGFRGKLAGLLPANFTPQGSGPLKVLINYPADAESEVVKAYLKSAVNLPIGPRITEDFRHTPTESITVVLFRTAMGVTEVDEVRDVLRLWSKAQGNPEPTDLLRWRQRTGYDFGYLATRETHRVEILHRVLAALWNGRATVVGPEESPERINVQLGGGVTMTLPLTPLGKASSWGSLLRSYELWALDDSDIHRQFCGQLMRELPGGISGRPRQPDQLYLVVRDLAEGQIEILDEMLKAQGISQQSRAVQMRSFWAVTLPGALDQQFTQVEAPVAASLRGLERMVDAGAAG
jgi:hypothetical protein